MSGVQVDGFCKVFPARGGKESVAALENVSLEIRPDECLTLIGPSGCGKTTLLRCVAGLERPDAGRIIIGGGRADHLGPAARNAAFVFQDPVLYPQMTARENLAAPLRIRKSSPAEIDRRVSEVSAMLGLEAGLLAQKPHELSGGERQRVALGRALLLDPSVFLLDEPLSNLEPSMRWKLREEILRIQKVASKPMLYVTHDQSEAMNMGGRIAVMQRGRVEQVGSGRALYESPASAFVAAFFGTPTINLLNARVEGERLIILNNARQAEPSFPEFPAAGHALKGRESAVFLLGIRPEDISVEKEGEKLVAGSVVASETTGTEGHLRVRVGEAILTVRTRAFPEQRPNEPVRLRLNLDHLHFFDPSSGRRV